MKTSLMKMRRLGVVFLALVAMWGSFSGCVSDGSGPGSGPVEKDVEGPGGDWIRIGDEIVVSFSGVQNPPHPHQERVKADGSITLPYIGPIQAAGKDRGELEKEIYTAYTEKYFQSHLSVNVTNQSRFFYVKGQVNSPNQLPYLTGMTVLKAISAAGDFTPFAKRWDVKVIRHSGEEFSVDCDEALRDPSKDVKIYPGDLIEVPRRVI